MGAMFIGQQFLQNVLGYSTLQRRARRSSRRHWRWWWWRRGRPSSSRPAVRGSRCVRIRLRAPRLPHDVPALERGHLVLPVAAGYVCVGIGVGLAGTPASHSLTGSVPVSRAGMASGTADLQRDLGGAFMTSIFGALLTAGFAAAMAAAIARVAGRGAGHDGDPGPADEVVLERRGGRAAIPAVRHGDHRGGEVVIPRRRRRGVPGRPRGRAARRGARHAQVPEEGRGGTTPRRIPRRGRRPAPCSAGRTADPFPQPA